MAREVGEPTKVIRSTSNLRETIGGTKTKKLKEEGEEGTATRKNLTQPMNIVEGMENPKADTDTEAKKIQEKMTEEELMTQPMNTTGKVGKAIAENEVRKDQEKTMREVALRS